MKDRDFLIWLHERLTEVHGENKLYDYMHKLRSIIYETPKHIETPNTTRTNSIEELKKELEEKDNG